MATRMQQRRGTSAEWTSANPILASGEIGFETDTNQFRIGDGVSSWTSLSYFETLDDIQTFIDNAVAGVIDSAPDTLNTLNELAAALNDDANAFTTLSNQITSGDAATLSSAQSYADTAEADAISTAAVDATTKADAAQAAAEGYADTQDAVLYAQITSDYEAYTNSETSDKATFDYVDAGDAATLAGSTSFTETKIDRDVVPFTLMLMGV